MSQEVALGFLMKISVSFKKNVATSLRQREDNKRDNVESLRAWQRHGRECSGSIKGLSGS